MKNQKSDYSCSVWDDWDADNKELWKEKKKDAEEEKSSWDKADEIKEKSKADGNKSKSRNENSAKHMDRNEGSDSGNDWGNYSSGSQGGFSHNSSDSWAGSGPDWGGESRYSDKKSFPKGRIFALIAVLIVIVLVPAVFHFVPNSKNPDTDPVISQQASPVLPDVPEPTINPNPVESQKPVNNEIPKSSNAYNIASKRYFGRKLSPAHQKIYNKLYGAALLHKDKVEGIELRNYEELHPIYEALYNDCPELFWLSAYKTLYFENTDGVTIDLEFDYRYDYDQWLKCNELVKREAGKIIDSVQGLGEYETVKAVFEKLIEMTQYDLNYLGMSLYEFFADNRSVCENYARAAQYILNELGIENIYMSGEVLPEWTEVDNLCHAWNLVKVEGQWYHMDVTWGDGKMQDGTEFTNYIYLLSNDEDFSKSRSWDKSLYPSCNSQDCSYHKKEGIYFESFDTDRMDAFIDSYLREPESTGKEYLELRFAEKSDYNQFINKYFDNKRIFKLTENTYGYGKSYTRLYFDEFNTIFIWIV